MKVFAMFALASALAVPAAFSQNSGLQQEVQKALHGSQFKNVQVAVDNNGIVTLSGTVDIYQAKVNAERKARHVAGNGAIRDEIQVAGPELSDQQLQEKVAKAINYGLIGYVPVAFQAITVQAHNGAVLLGGHAAGPIAASDALAIAENVKGVKDLVDNIQVDPLSPMDDRIRMAEFRAVYSSPFLSQYAIDPEKPIRIQVVNGHVTLYGVVDSEAQKNAAGIKANSVPGVFSVTNDIEVAGAPAEKPQK
ncbi:MAG: BON domain-containing protein [Acidobacteriaceae bacterium]